MTLADSEFNIRLHGPHVGVRGNPEILGHTNGSLEVQENDLHKPSVLTCEAHTADQSLY